MQWKRVCIYKILCSYCMSSWLQIKHFSSSSHSDKRNQEEFKPGGGRFRGDISKFIFKLLLIYPSKVHHFYGNHLPELQWERNGSNRPGSHQVSGLCINFKTTLIHQSVNALPLFLLIQFPYSVTDRESLSHIKKWKEHSKYRGQFKEWVSLQCLTESHYEVRETDQLRAVSFALTAHLAVGF